MRLPKPLKKTTDLPPDGLIEAIATPRRMAVIRLVDERAPTDVSDLSEELLEIEGRNGAGESQNRKRFYVSLIQSHLPKLDSLDVIEYDNDRKTVGRGRNLPGVLAAIEDIESRSAVE